MSKYLETGKIVGVFGLKGELKVISDSTTNRFKKGNKLYLGKCEKNVIPVEITSARMHKGLHLVVINNLEDINLVEKYVNQYFYIDREEMHDLKPNEYYFDDLINLNVKDEQGNIYGKVIDMLDLPSSAVLEVMFGDKKIMIPFVAAYIKDVTKEDIIVTRIEEFL